MNKRMESLGLFHGLALRWCEGMILGEDALGRWKELLAVGCGWSEGDEVLC